MYKLVSSNPSLLTFKYLKINLQNNKYKLKSFLKLLRSLLSFSSLWPPLPLLECSFPRPTLEPPPSPTMSRPPLLASLLLQSPLTELVMLQPSLVKHWLLKKTENCNWIRIIKQINLKWFRYGNNFELPFDFFALFIHIPTHNLKNWYIFINAAFASHKKYMEVWLEMRILKDCI